MDELELLKKDWQQRKQVYPNLSHTDIYNLLHKKSSSIVKWIFIIGIAEFIFWGVLNLFIPDRIFDIYDQLHLKKILSYSYIFHYTVSIVFLYLFYNNHKAIRVTDSTNNLMKNIIKTRKTVNFYVYYNIGLYVILSVVFNIVLFSDVDLLLQVMTPEKLNIDQSKFFNMFLITQIIVLVVMCGLLYLYYRIIYGILLRKLNKNYNELESLE
ncbi:hypothetical protein [Lutibacter sp.]|uniref:hypothetical protein n=1 Tax=Lutibacter sp. TaxID=1925666 RepID=UPI0027365BEF|nr:hypothetical protein [Lutibacter sp.]MDP3312230.1 hypothetical protein [Lutibacter sp.]